MLQNSKCKVCNASGSTTLQTREMMFGTRVVFNYQECLDCGTLQILNPPDDYKPYYPSNYYSYSQESSFRVFIKKHSAAYAWRGRDVLGYLFSLFLGNDEVFSIKPLGLDFDRKILDVGCGSGLFLRNLWSFGFNHLMGIDPYLPESAQQQKPFPILKGDLQSLQHMTFDLITLHHVFEHLPDPIETLKAIEKLLNPQGIILIRVPIADSWAYEHYKENWFALDPPRHVFIHTRKGMSLLCDKAGLEVFEMRHDSNCFQFLFSNFYQRNLPMYGSHSPLSNKFQIILKTPQMIYWNLKAQKLNREQRGDQICFYLRKKTNPAHCLDSTR